VAEFAAGGGSSAFHKHLLQIRSVEEALHGAKAALLDRPRPPPLTLGAAPPCDDIDDLVAQLLPTPPPDPTLSTAEWPKLPTELQTISTTAARGGGGGGGGDDDDDDDSGGDSKLLDESLADDSLLDGFDSLLDSPPPSEGPEEDSSQVTPPTTESDVAGLTVEAPS
jgi:hypothetical protein